MRAPSGTRRGVRSAATLAGAEAARSARSRSPAANSSRSSRPAAPLILAASVAEQQAPAAASARPVAAAAPGARPPRAPVEAHPSARPYAEPLGDGSAASGSGSASASRSSAPSRARRDGVHRAGRERLLEQLGGMRLDLESQPGAVAGKTQQAGGVVDEVRSWRTRSSASREVVERVVDGAKLARVGSGQVDGDRVDGEVPPGRSSSSVRRLDLREGSGARVALAARLATSTLPAATRRARSPKRSWRVSDGDALAADASSSPQQLRGEAAPRLADRPRPAPRRAPQEEVADAPRRPGHVPWRRRARPAPRPRVTFVEPLEDDRRVDVITGMRTGDPGAGEVAFASATVKRP